MSRQSAGPGYYGVASNGALDFNDSLGSWRNINDVSLEINRLITRSPNTAWLHSSQGNPTPLRKLFLGQDDQPAFRRLYLLRQRCPASDTGRVYKNVLPTY